jgi:hypothetical protein
LWIKGLEGNPSNICPNMHLNLITLAFLNITRPTPAQPLLLSLLLTLAAYTCVQLFMETSCWLVRRFECSTTKSVTIVRCEIMT